MIARDESHVFPTVVSLHSTSQSLTLFPLPAAVKRPGAVSSRYRDEGYRVWPAPEMLVQR